MANFSNNAITDVGRMLLADVQAGAVFVPTRIVMGSGLIPSGYTAHSMTHVITPVRSLEINKKIRTPDGKCIFGGVYTNAEITEPFYFRELALYAKAVYYNDDGTQTHGKETLYSYGNAGATADYMADNSDSTVVEKQIDLVTWVGNEAKVDLTIESGILIKRSHAMQNLGFINPGTVGYDSLLEYMASIYEQNITVCGSISGFTDMPEGVTQMHGYINVVGGILTIYGNSRTAYYYRGTNSITEWTEEWSKAYDATEDLVINKSIAAVKLETPNGSGQFFKNANDVNDLGTTISDSTKDGALVDRVNLSAARPLADKLRLVVNGTEIYNILHTGNTKFIKPTEIGAAPAGYVSKVYQAFSDADIEAAMLDAYNLTADNAIGYFAIYSNLENLMLGGGVWHLTVYRRDASYGIIEANSYDLKSTRKMVRCRYEGVFQPIAWDNPPMAQGIEYRTTERFHNEVVYKKIDANGNILWRKESENLWRLLSSASYVSPASV